MTLRQDLEQILLKDGWQVRDALVKYVAGMDSQEYKQRTLSQNDAMWLDCQMIATKLEEGGLDWKKIIKEGIDIPVTKDSVMEFLWRPTMRVMFNLTSTKDLAKNLDQQGKIHEVIMRTLGQKHGVEWHDFPHIDPSDPAPLS